MGFGAARILERTDAFKNVLDVHSTAFSGSS
jgi:hypothetical protein